MRVNRQKPLPGHAAAYEAARKKHMEWHKQAGDAWAWNVWKVTTGPETGSYLVTTGGHQWADFDAWTAKHGAGDMADANASVGQHVASNERSYWTTRPDMSLMPPSGDLPPMGTVTTFFIKPGLGGQFVAAVMKINQALSKSNWPLSGVWYDALELLACIPADRQVITESGILAPEHVALVRAGGQWLPRGRGVHARSRPRGGARAPVRPANLRLRPCSIWTLSSPRSTTRCAPSSRRPMLGGPRRAGICRKPRCRKRERRHVAALMRVNHGGG